MKPYSINTVVKVVACADEINAGRLSVSVDLQLEGSNERVLSRVDYERVLSRDDYLEKSENADLQEWLVRFTFADGSNAIVGDWSEVWVGSVF